MTHKGSPARRGMTKRQLAELAGISEATVSRRYSEPRKEYLARAQARKQAAVDLRKQGMTIRAIAEELGVSVGSVHRYIKQAREDGTLES